MKAIFATAFTSIAVLAGAANAEAVDFLGQATTDASVRHIESVIPGTSLAGLTDHEVVSVSKAIEIVEGAAKEKGVAQALINTYRAEP